MKNFILTVVVFCSLLFLYQALLFPGNLDMPQIKRSVDAGHKAVKIIGGLVKEVVNEKGA